MNLSAYILLLCSGPLATVTASYKENEWVIHSLHAKGMILCEREIAACLDKKTNNSLPKNAIIGSDETVHKIRLCLKDFVGQAEPVIRKGKK